MPEEKTPKTRLKSIAAEIDSGQKPTATVRELLGWFGSKRRGIYVVDGINAALAEAGLVTEPDFSSVWIDAEVTFKRIKQRNAGARVPDERSPDEEHGGQQPYLIRMLDAANREVTSVSSNDPIEKAVTLMLANDFSQLPVMDGPRNLKGLISWKTIGSRLSQKSPLTEVRNAMEPAEEVEDTDTLSRAIDKIVAADCVMVRARDRSVTGIVTATDLSEQFHNLSEPFMILNIIEGHLRRLIGDRFDLETIKAACVDADPGRADRIVSAADLTIGEHQRILEVPDNWEHLGLFADRCAFIDLLDKVRERRNEVMHFHPDGIDEEGMEQLRSFARLLDQLLSLRPEKEAKD